MNTIFLLSIYNNSFEEMLYFGDGGDYSDDGVGDGGDGYIWW